MIFFQQADGCRIGGIYIGFYRMQPDNRKTIIEHYGQCLLRDTPAMKVGVQHITYFPAMVFFYNAPKADGANDAVPSFQRNAPGDAIPRQQQIIDNANQLNRVTNRPGHRAIDVLHGTAVGPKEEDILFVTIVNAP